MGKTVIIATAAIALLADSASLTVQAAERLDDRLVFEQQIAPFLAKHCIACHSGDSPRGNIQLDLASGAEAYKAFENDNDFWLRVATEVSSQRMPPSFAGTKPTAEERTLLAKWVNANAPNASNEPDAVSFMIPRLNNRQYANTVRDLLYLPSDYDAATDFPPDERGDGFDNNAGTLTISSLLVENYLLAAEKAADAALALDPEASPAAKAAALPSIAKLNEPSANFEVDFANRQQKVRLNIEAFAPRAFRRPVSSEEVDGLMKFAALAFTHFGGGDTNNQAAGLAIRAALMSPEFLFRIERDPNPDGFGKVFEITEYQLASRLSYFLWSTMPDDELYIAARDNELRETLDEQIARMLQDPKAISLTKDFAGQWLEIRGMREVTNASESLLDSMQGETEHFFDYIIRNDRSIMEFLDADYTFVNEELARLYGIPGVSGDEFRKVQVDRTQRGGIFTQASFLTLTSKPLGNTRRTSPVLRGKWILENIFNEKIPPPPPDVPDLDFDPNKELKGTVRQIFEQHRVDPNCSVCHARMDPYGFALENYDGYGAWRQQDNKVDVDPSGEINGKTFETPVQFRTILAERHDDFRQAVVRKVLSYALGRGIRTQDRSTIDAICEAVEADGDRFSSVIAHVVRSYPFQHARGMKESTAKESPDTVWIHPVSNKPEPAAEEQQ